MTIIFYVLGTLGYNISNILDFCYRPEVDNLLSYTDLIIYMTCTTVFNLINTLCTYRFEKYILIKVYPDQLDGF